MNFLRLLSAAFVSRKFVMTMFGLCSLWLVYWKQVDYLYSFAGMGSEMVAAYVSITRDFMVAFTAAVLAYLGVNGIVSWKHSTESVLSQVSETINSTHTEKREDVQRIIHESAEQFKDDPSYRPIQPDTEDQFR